MNEEMICNIPVAIEMKQFGYKIGQQQLLYDINWTIHKGECWVLFGMNGCGKTTLLSAIAGYTPYTSGKLKVFGEPYSVNNIFSLRKKIGLVSNSFFDKQFQRESVLNIVLSGLNGTFGLCENLKDDDVYRAKLFLKELHLQDKENHSFHKLSKGERQNVLIARSLIAEPEILLLDEPGTGLDIYAREYMLHIVETLALEKKLTIIYVTHYTEEILPLFQHCALMKNGTIFQKGATKNLFQKSLLESFLGYPIAIHLEKDRNYITVEEGYF